MASEYGRSASFVNPRQGIYETSSKAKADIGRQLELKDGRVFTYCKNDTTALVAGAYVQASQPIANHTNIAVGVDAGVGDTDVTVTLGATAVTQNQYANGYMIVNAGAGLGITYKIKSHPSANASANVKLTLYDPIVVALTTATSKVCLLKHPADTVSAQASQAAVGIGFAMVAVPASHYFWALKTGIVGVITGGAYAIGKGIVASAATAGQVIAATVAGEVPVGRLIVAGVASECRPAQIDIY